MPIHQSAVHYKKP